MRNRRLAREVMADVGMDVLGVGAADNSLFGSGGSGLPDDGTDGSDEQRWMDGGSAVDAGLVPHPEWGAGRDSERSGGGGGDVGGDTGDGGDGGGGGSNTGKQWRQQRWWHQQWYQGVGRHGWQQQWCMVLGWRATTIPANKGAEGAVNAREVIIGL